MPRLNRWFHAPIQGFPAQYCLCISEADFKAQLRRMKIPKADRPPFTCEDASGVCHLFSTPRHLAIIALGSTKGQSQEYIYSTIIHESVHIKQWLQELMDEDKMGEETEAYLVESITYNLMRSYKQLSKKSKDP